MNTKAIQLSLAVMIPLAMCGIAQGRHVTHPVAPQNIDTLPYAFSVQVKDAGEFKEFEIRVKPAAGKRNPGLGARGDLDIAKVSKQQVEVPPLTMVKYKGEITFTFKIPTQYLDWAHFTYTESSEGPFPVPGDYWVFNLDKFASVANAKPGKENTIPKPKSHSR